MDEHWRVAHAIDTSLPGWLVVVPRRHATRLSELRAEELTHLGPILGAASRALELVTGCLKTYVALFAEQEGFAHIHFHVVPRMPNFTADEIGPRSLFAFLGAGDRELSEATRDELSLAIATAMSS